MQAVKSGFNLNKKTGAIFIDIEKAFDKVWHIGLIYKLKNYQFPKYLVKWIENYLSSREFRVRVNESLSDFRQIYTEVPQGSVLGPTLFNIFFNDVACAAAKSTEMALFADDLSAWFTSGNICMIQLKLQTFLNDLNLWLSMWRLRLKVLGNQTT